jgi:hypothetical protein
VSHHFIAHGIVRVLGPPGFNLRATTDCSITIPFQRIRVAIRPRTRNFTAITPFALPSAAP